MIVFCFFVICVVETTKHNKKNKKEEMETEGLRYKQTEAIVRCLQLSESEGKRFFFFFFFF